MRSLRTLRSAARVRVCFVLIAFVISLFAARLFQLQGIDSNAYATMALEQGSTTVTLHAERGAIVDRNGEPLATSIDAEAITADPKLTAKHAFKIATLLVDTLGLDYFDTVTKLQKPNTRFVYLARKIPQWKADSAIKQLEAAKLLGVRTERDTLRTYPGDGLAANVLGLVSASGAGAAGLESEYQSKLAGKDGSATYETAPGDDGATIPMARQTVKKAVPGTGVRTTLDRDLQWFADRRLAQAVHETKSDWGVAVTVDLKTMQVLQLSQLPTFDANTASTIKKDNVNARAVQNVYEPGSVQKVLTMAALADSGKVDLGTRVKVPPQLVIDHFRIGDAWSHPTIHLTGAGVIARSSNLGTIVLSQQLSDTRLHDYLSSFGFGRPTGVGLPGESGGILPPADTWSRANHATIAFGQGISVTAMQEVAAVATIANKGVYTQPSLVTGLVAPDGSTTSTPAPASHRVVSAKAAGIVTSMMEAVTNKGGTAPNTAIPGYRVAGKTGTAWRVNPTTGRYVHGENTVSFMGFAPADKPRFLTYVVLDKPAGGGTGSGMAGPVFRSIMMTALERYGVPPTGSTAPKTPLRW